MMAPSKELKFEAEDKPIKEILFSHQRFKVPRYQRPYAWTEDQVNEFWSDLNSESHSFFIGSFILNYENIDKDGFVEIVDGQQRILTITILLAALRDIAKSINPETAQRYQRQNIALEGWSGDLTYRIDCGDTARDFFVTHIQEYDANILDAIPATKEEKRIKENYEYFYSRITEDLKAYEGKGDKLKALDKIRDKVGDLIAIHMKIEREEDAFEIFETTNARGVDLNIADLLKNLIFKNIRPKGEKDVAKEKWFKVEGNILSTGTELKKFLRYYWISKHSFLTEKKLFREIKREITNWERFLDDLVNTSELFALLLEGDAKDWEEWGAKNPDKIYKSLSAIRFMNVSQCYVLFLSILRNYKKLGTDPTRVFQLIEHFTFNYSAISKFPGNRVEKIYSSYALQLEAIASTETAKKIPGKVNSLFSQLEKELRDERPQKETFKDAFMDFRYKQSEQGRMLVKYVLSEINNYYARTAEHKIDFDNVNVEHLLPQNPGKGWGLKKEDIKEYVNLLGNLTLLDKRINSAIGNKQMSEKLEHLKQSELPVTRKLVERILAQQGKWDEQDVRVRQTEFAELAYTKIWNH